MDLNNVIMESPNKLFIVENHLNYCLPHELCFSYNNSHHWIWPHRLTSMATLQHSKYDGTQQQTKIALQIKHMSKGWFTPWTEKLDHGRWPFPWSSFFKETIYKAFGPLTRCKPNVNHEE